MTATAAEIDRPRRGQVGNAPAEVDVSPPPWPLGGYIRRFLPRR